MNDDIEQECEQCSYLATRIRRQRASARKVPVQDRSRQTVEVILDAAVHLFVDRGYAATTTDRVAEAAGVSIGSLYEYFPNKDALVVALDLRHLDHAEARLRIRLAALARDGPPPAEWARRLVGVLVAINESDLIGCCTASRRPCRKSKDEWRRWCASWRRMPSGTSPVSERTRQLPESVRASLWSRRSRWCTR